MDNLTGGEVGIVAWGQPSGQLNKIQDDQDQIKKNRKEERQFI